jgi:hypothetical protein
VIYQGKYETFDIEDIAFFEKGSPRLDGNVMVIFKFSCWNFDHDERELTILLDAEEGERVMDLWAKSKQKKKEGDAS